MSKTVEPLSTTALQMAAKPNKKKGASFFSRSWPIITMLVIIISAMWIASLFFPPYVLPGPWKVAQGVVELFQTEYKDMFLTLGRYLFALVSAIIAGWAVGLLMGAFRNFFGRFMQPFISVVQAASLTAQMRHGNALSA